MGLTIAKLVSMFSSTKSARILVLGLDGAGKTTILYKLKLDEVVQSVPTIGFNVEHIDYKNLHFTLWDVGGQDKIRLLWKHYFEGTDALIYVIDSSDKERIDIAREELLSMMATPELSSAALLVMANKQDLGVMNVAEVTDKLGLYSLRGRDWFIQGTNALTGEGLYAGFDWLSKTLKEKK